MTFNIPPEKQVSDLEEFKLFSKEIEELTDFLRHFSDLITDRGTLTSFITSKGILYIGTELLDSSVQTLKSIKLCCGIGSFSDANTLIRKLRDDLLLYVYILHIKEHRKPFIEDSKEELDFSNINTFTSAILNLKYNDELTDDEQAVEAWLSGKINDLHYKVKKKLSFENYMERLKEDEHISTILSKYQLHDYWEKLRSRLNDNVHNNGIQFAYQNIPKMYGQKPAVHLKNVTTRTSYVLSIFMILLIMVDPKMIASTDMIDYLDADMTPPDGSQYFVARVVQEFIDIEIVPLHPELKQYLIDNNRYGMKIE